MSPLQCHQVVKNFEIIDRKQAVRLILGLSVDTQLVHALTDVTVDVPAGQILGVLGRNGAGKSTLLRILGGVYQPTTGTVLCSGDTGALFEMGLSSSPTMTGYQHAKRYLEIQNVAPSKIQVMLKEIQEFSELGEAFFRPIYTYSSGMGARLYFSTATAPQHSVYLIDEALSVGDEHFQAKCWKRIRERLSKGACGVLVTHDWSAVLRLCANACVLENGRVVAEGKSEDIVRGFLSIGSTALLDGAKFSDLPEQILLRSGEDAELPFNISITEVRPLVFLYSVERMVVGSGWDILLLSDEMPIKSATGQYQIVLKIPRLPLPPGSYYLNIFLSTPYSLHHPREPYDVRGWTCGTPILLKVCGDSEVSHGVISLPIDWATEDVI